MKRWPVLLALLVAVALLRLFVASVGFGWSEQWLLRVDQGVAAGLAGAALAVAGLMLQSFLRNPLADPYVLGLASGAGLSATLAECLGLWTGWWLGPRPLWALAGAAGACLCVGLFSRGRRTSGGPDPAGTLLSGVVIGLCAAAGMTLLSQFLPPERRLALTQWMIGSVDGQFPDAVRGLSFAVVGALLALALLWGAWRGPLLDAALLDEAEARALGLPLAQLRWGLFAGAAALTVGAMALCGPVAFVGFIAPHAARRLCGPRHRQLLPASALLGAALVVAGDVAGEWVFALPGHPGVVPVGVFTILLGGPAFLLMLRRR